MTYMHLTEKAYHKGLGEEAMWKMAEMTDKFVESMRPLHPAEVDKFLHDIENEVCYPKLTEKEAKEYVAAMTNKDGTTGEHWSLAQTDAYIASHPEYKELDSICFYVAMNMMYSDYWKAAFTTDTYAQLAKDFLTDKDAPGHKVRRYMEAMK